MNPSDTIPCDMNGSSDMNSSSTKMLQILEKMRGSNSKMLQNKSQKASGPYLRYSKILEHIYVSRSLTRTPTIVVNTKWWPLRFILHVDVHIHRFERTTGSDAYTTQWYVVFFDQKSEEGKRSSLQWCCSRRLPCGLRMYWMAWPNCTTLDCGLLSIQRLEPHPEVFHICDICPCPWESKVFVVGIAAPMPLKSLNGINMN